MNRAYNFSAGPAMLPESVLQRVKDELFDWQGTGVSIMEIGHRTSHFKEMLIKIQDKLRKLMKIPTNYKILFATGGAQGQFSAIPMNLVRNNPAVDYFVTGTWSEKAVIQAKKYAKPNLVTTALDSKISDKSTWKLNPNATYAYYCPNETVAGIQFPEIPCTGNVPLIADMTSSILSFPCDVSKFGMIFASAQKNLGIAGITVIIIRDDLLDQALDFTPHVWQYKTLADNDSNINTPPVFPIYMVDLMLDWMEEQGGVEEIARINTLKAQKIYNYIDESEFYYNKIKQPYRSRINATFDLVKPELLDKFLTEANNNGLKYLKGHILAGGVRASMYNAMPLAGVENLIDFMQDFVNTHRF